MPDERRESVGPDGTAPPPASFEWPQVARALFEQSPFSSVIYDAEGHPLAVNEAFERIWGVSLATAPPGYSVLKDPELEKQGALPTIRRAFAGEAVVTPPLRYDIARISTSGTGHAIWTAGHFFPVRDDTGRVTHVVLMHIDLTERMEALEQQQAATARVQRLQDITAGFASALTAEQVAAITLEVGLTALGARSGVVYVMSADGETLEASALRGIPEQAVAPWMRLPVSESMLVSDAVRERRPIYAPSRAHTLDQYPTARDANRLVEAESWSAIPLLHDSRPLGALALGFDARREFSEEERAFIEAVGRQCAQALERARLYEAERAARAEAEAANRTKSEFLATMSHELRTPLNAIAGYAELLEMGIRGALTPEQGEDVARIKRSQRHLLSLIEDVLSFARIESGHVELEVQAVPVGRVLTASQELLEPLLRHKKLDYELCTIPEKTLVLADEEALRQILLNLLSNAVKFTERGRVWVTCAVTDLTLSLSVHDTGKGIPPSRLGDIFDPFVQVEAGLTRTSAGSGLGLAIARDLARRMGGDVTVQSTVNQGSVFTLTLRRADAAAAK